VAASETDHPAAGRPGAAKAAAPGHGPPEEGDEGRAGQAGGQGTPPAGSGCPAATAAPAPPETPGGATGRGPPAAGEQVEDEQGRLDRQMLDRTRPHGAAPGTALPAMTEQDRSDRQELDRTRPHGAAPGTALPARKAGGPNGSSPREGRRREQKAVPRDSAPAVGGQPAARAGGQQPKRPTCL